MNYKSSAQVPFFHPDGLSITAAEPWFKVKVQVIERYVQSFIANASGRADHVLIVDLAAGSGLYSFGHQKEIFPGSGLSLLSAGLPVSHWIFCEQNREQAFALKSRIDQHFSDRQTSVVDSPMDQWVDTLRNYFPKSNRGNKAAILCLVDPFGFDIPFLLINKLASLGVSFLTTFTWPMNDRMNYAYYRDEKADRLRSYLGISDLQRLASTESNPQFYKHVVRIYQNNMLMLGLNTALSIHKLDSQFMKLPAYYMGFFSRQFSTKAIQHDVHLQEHPQIALW